LHGRREGIRSRAPTKEMIGAKRYPLVGTLYSPIPGAARKK